MDKQVLFSDELKDWLKSSKPKTLAGLDEVFGERSFAIAFLGLMSLPALPIPTGGISHVFEAIVMILALELIAGRRTIWLPASWKRLKLNKTIEKKAVPFLIRRIKWMERYAKPRLSGLLFSRLFRSLTGLVVLFLTLLAFFAPPFSGLDTLPSLGVVIISLSLIIGDAALFLAGLLTAAVGAGLVLGIGLAGKSLIEAIF